MKNKIELMLQVYREKLERLETPPIDYAEGLRISAIIGVLENLYFYALQEERKRGTC